MSLGRHLQGTVTRFSSLSLAGWRGNFDRLRRQRSYRTCSSDGNGSVRRLAEAPKSRNRRLVYTGTMRLAAFSAENYRAFVDHVDVELRPLTLLFGYNSAGKSAVLRLLPIVAASTRPDQPAPLALHSEAARGASFKEMLSRQSASPTLKVGLEWKDSLKGDLRATVSIRDLPDRKTQIVEKLEIFELSEPVRLLEALWNTQPASSPFGGRQYDLKTGNASAGTFDMSFDGLVPDVPSNQSFTEMLNRASSAIRSVGEQVHWLNSLRAVPLRASRFGIPPLRMASDGANASDYLAYDSIADGKLLEDTSAWFERITGHRLSVRQYALAGEDQYSIVLAPLLAKPPIEIPIMDTGEGMSQVLPVIVLGSLARLMRLGPEPLLAIEHPELHLHPAAHAELAAFFCGLVSSASKPTIVVETHSENLLLRVQIAIARREISADDVVVHWVRALEDGRSVVDTITFDEVAQPRGAGWPPSVFSEDNEQAKILLRLRKERDLT